MLFYMSESKSKIGLYLSDSVLSEIVTLNEYHKISLICYCFIFCLCVKKLVMHSSPCWDLKTGFRHPSACFRKQEKLAVESNLA